STRISETRHLVSYKRAVPLQIVIQMREINQAERGLMFIFNPLGGFGDPAGDGVGRALRRLNSGGWAPETGKGKWAQVALDVPADVSGIGVNVEDLAAIGGIHRSRRDRIIRGGIHVVPPKKFRAGEVWVALAQFLPEFASVHEMVGLFPELDFGEFAVVPAVADDAMRVRRGAGEIGGLRGAGDGGKGGFDTGLFAARGEVADARGVLADEGVREADEVDDCGASHFVERFP